MTLSRVSIIDGLVARMTHVGSDEELLRRIRRYLDAPMTDGTKIALCRAAILKRDAEKERAEVR